ncbi:14960_t:CDS:1 [Acaulospora morrowiae]|uniref:14960_t:CDS:1 n=1 Tax=Acaulospora morrowiae TaxID=94023 RepID=A0A9N9EAX0_9GLOM|nr:14960_t:CDS:1 [Acaulospora morrowiae]
MYRAQWEGKLAINKHGDQPTEGYLPLVEIIYRLPHSLIFNPYTKAQHIYPRRRTKHDPRPMNSFMILTRVVRIVASDPRRNIDLGDGQSCTRICQLIRWGANKREWQIFLNLQEEFKKIHSFFFPKYDYRPKKNITTQNTNDFIIMNSDNYDEFTQSQQRKRSNRRKQNHLSGVLLYPSPAISPISSPVASIILPILDDPLFDYGAHMTHDKLTSNMVSTIPATQAEINFHHSLIIHPKTVDRVLSCPIFPWEPSIAVNCNH